MDATRRGKDKGSFAHCEIRFSPDCNNRPPRVFQKGPFCICIHPETQAAAQLWARKPMIAEGKQHRQHPALSGRRIKMIGGADVSNEKAKFIKVILEATSKP